jgi:hypothetical protein
MIEGRKGPTGALELKRKAFKKGLKDSKKGRSGRL